MSVIRTRLARAALAATVGLGGLSGALVVPEGAGAAGVTAFSGPDVATLARGSSQPVIIVLKDQLADHAVTDSARASAAGRAQASVRHDLQALHVDKVHGLTTVNAVAAALTPAESSWFAHRPDVLAVVPDRKLRSLASSTVAAAASSPSATGPTAHTSAGAAQATPAQATYDPTCPSDPSRPLTGQDLTLTHAMSPQGSSAPAAQDLATGRGVRVGLMVAGDNLNPDNPEFIRSDGSHVIVEDRNYGSAGTPAYPDLGGQEAFGDASAVAAQGHDSYDVSTYGFAQHPLPSGCTIRIRGMAPDASLYVADFTFTSEAIAAIDHLVTADHVDVINEAFWFQALPDDPTTDPFMLANEAAVRAGVTVVTPSNDGGIDSSQGTPGSDPGIIDVGATTAGRLYQQLKIAGFAFSNGLAEDNQPSSISSDGFATALPRIIDVVAPGDGGWNACTPGTAFPSCVSLTGAPSAFRAFRGTSESSPLTAGVVALVIERYRDTHSGTSPTPRQVKAILMSSATDLHVSARIQGSGLINALAAVRLAGDTSGLIAGGDSLGITGSPGQTVTRPIAITNPGRVPQIVRPEVQTLRTVVGATVPVTLDPYNDPRFFCAGPSSGVTRTIQLPRGLDQLTVEAAGAIDPQVGPQNAAVNLTLIDPSGKWANWSSSALPSAPFAHVEEARPMPGSWTVLVWTGQNANGWHGAVTLHWQGSRIVGQPAGPARLVNAGATASVPVSLRLPAAAGDSDVRLALVGQNGTTVLPAAVRTTIAMAGGRGSFGGMFTGIVGRTANGPTQVLAYSLPVRSSRSLEFDMHLTRLTMVHAYLIDPSGDVVAERTNCIDPDGHQLINDLVMYLDHPVPGNWLVALELDRRHGVVSSYDDPFTANVRLNTVAVTTNGLPNSDTLQLQTGHPVTATVSIANTGAQQQAFFADARSNELVDLPLAQQRQSEVGLPNTDFATLPTWLVPPTTSRLTVTGNSAVPFDFDLFPEQDDPDMPSSAGTTATATVEGPAIAPTLWSVTGDTLDPADVGTTAQFTAIAHTAAFDPAVVTSTGDAWQASFDSGALASPIVVPAHGSGTITVTITPRGAPGTVVTGTLFIDMTDCVAGVGDTVTALPYRYRIA